MERYVAQAQVVALVGSFSRSNSEPEPAIPLGGAAADLDFSVLVPWAESRIGYRLCASYFLAEVERKRWFL